MATTNPKGSLDGVTVTIGGSQINRAADLPEDRLHDVVSDLRGEIEAGICSGTYEHSSLVLREAIEKITEIQGYLEAIRFGDEIGPVELPVSALFAPLTKKQLRELEKRREFDEQMRTIEAHANAANEVER